MNKDEQLQRLLRLKRHEQPPDGFAEEFLEKFQRRQRADLLNRSTLSILGDRMRAWLESLRRPVVVWSLCGAYAAIMLTLWLVPRSTPHGDVTVVWGRDTVSAPQVDHKPGTQVNAPAGGTITPIPNYGGPGKRRTTDQEQNKESLIGPEEKNSGNPEPPLRDL